MDSKKSKDFKDKRRGTFEIVKGMQKKKAHMGQNFQIYKIINDVVKVKF